MTLHSIPTYNGGVEDAKSVLLETIEEQPDGVVILCFWQKDGVFQIKTSSISDRLKLIGALEEAKFVLMANA